MLAAPTLEDGSALSGFSAMATVAVSLADSMRAMSSLRCFPLRDIAKSFFISIATRAFEPVHVHGKPSTSLFASLTFGSGVGRARYRVISRDAWGV